LVKSGDFAHTPGVERVLFRAPSSADADAVARLHAASWRRHYRGAYADSFLDGDVVGDRLAVWRKRLSAPGENALTLLAECDKQAVGFAHTVLGSDPAWGALVDNLHVDLTLQRHGIGRSLLARSAAFVTDCAKQPGMYLWVLEQNVAAQRFYAAAGGQPVESRPVSDPGGRPGRLAGAPRCLRYVWRDASDLARLDLAASVCHARPAHAHPDQRRPHASEEHAVGVQQPAPVAAVGPDVHHEERARSG
jgi:GNAT superfamily N-acetyltransferase